MANQIGMTIEQLGSLALSRSPNSSAYKGMTARQVGEMLVTKNKAYSGGKTFDFQQPKKYADYKKASPVLSLPTTQTTPTEKVDRTEEWTSTVKNAISRLKSGETWGTVWNDVKSQFPDLSNSFIDEQLGGGGGRGWSAPGAYESYKKRQQEEKIQSAKEATGGFVSGAAKGVGYSLSGLSSVGQTILDSTFGAATRWGLGKAGIETKAPVNAGQVIKEKYFTPETTAEKVGFGAEQLAEWFIPAGAGSKVISKIPVFSKLVKGAGSVSKVEKVATGAKEVKTAQEAIQGASKATEIMKTISGTGKTSPLLQK